ncbi:MAG: CRTAC1 family protein [Flavobacteriales bacterium]|nr:CRTAC1 family protein [Flavobacteriales bacterium]
MIFKSPLFKRVLILAFGVGCLWLGITTYQGVSFLLNPNVSITPDTSQSIIPKGTHIMTRLLQDAINRENIVMLPFEMTHKLRLIDFLLKNTHWLNQDWKASMKQWRAEMLLDYGSSEQAITQIEDLMIQLGYATDHVSEENVYLMRLLAVAHLRAGEQENCFSNHNAKSCIFPFHPLAYHKTEEHVTRASEIYSKILAFAPNDRTARWLLNVCQSALGNYPNGLAEELLVPIPQACTEVDRGSIFENKAAALGIDDGRVAGGVVIDDFNNDGLFDLFVSSFGIKDQLKYYERVADGTFVDKTKQAGILGLTGGLNMVQADYNNDGLVDLLVLRGSWFGASGCYPNSLLKNLGNGTFEDVTIESGLYSEFPTQVACWGDFNLDGWVDVFIGNEVRDEDVYNSNTKEDAYPSEFYVNNGDGTFTNLASKYGLEINGFVKGAVWTDIDNDRLQDLLVSVKGRGNLLFHNQGGTSIGNWSFQNISKTADIKDPIQSFGAASFDIDNDGFQDLIICDYDDINNTPEKAFVSEMLGEKAVVTMAVYHNNGNNTYEDITQKAGLGKQLYTMGFNYGDYNNDGFLDFFAGTGAPDYSSLVPNRLFKNAGNNQFEDVTFSYGFGSLQKGHGVSFADLDHDGNLDIYLVQGGAFQGDQYPNACYMNSGNNGSWLSMKLIGSKSNRSAIGAVVRVDFTDSLHNKRYLFRTVSSGGSFGANPFDVHVGLGNTSTIDSITVTWPNKNHTTQTFRTISVNQFLVIREDSDHIEIVQKNKISIESNSTSSGSCILVPSTVKNQSNTWRW